MALFWLLFVVGVVNVCLGYGLAVCQGYGLPSLRDAWIGDERPPGTSSAADPIPTASEPASEASRPLDQLAEPDPAEPREVEPHDDDERSRK